MNYQEATAKLGNRGIAETRKQHVLAAPGEWENRATAAQHRHNRVAGGRADDHVKWRVADGNY